MLLDNQYHASILEQELKANQDKVKQVIQSGEYVSRVLKNVTQVRLIVCGNYSREMATRLARDIQTVLTVPETRRADKMSKVLRI